MIDTKIIFDLYDIANEINDLGIISPQEVTENSKILSKTDVKYLEVDHVKGFVMLINNDNCKKTEYFDENFFYTLRK